jgi:N-acetylneuraminic acid mutarotase
MLHSQGRQFIQWTQGADLPLGRGGYASGVLNGSLVLAGGTYWKSGKKLWLDEVVAYRPPANRWEMLSPLPKPLAYGAAATHDGAFYYVGGAGPEVAERTCYRLIKRKIGYQWEAISPLPKDRVYARAVVVGQQLYLTGGTDHPSRLDTASSELMVLPLSDSKTSWRLLSPIPDQGRAVLAAAACAGKIYVFGGCYADAEGRLINLASAYRYDPVSDQWTRLKDTPAATRAWSACALDDRYICLFGGYAILGHPSSTAEAGQFERRVLRYDTVRDEYVEVDSLPKANADMSFHFLKGAFYGAGGEPKGRERAPWTFVGKIAGK